MAAQRQSGHADPADSHHGQRGHIVDYAVGEAVSGITSGLRILARPWDRLELDVHYDRNVLEGLVGATAPTTETAMQFFGTWHSSTRLSALPIPNDRWQRMTRAKA